LAVTFVSGNLFVVEAEAAYSMRGEKEGEPGSLGKANGLNEEKKNC